MSSNNFINKLHGLPFVVQAICKQLHLKSKFTKDDLKAFTTSQLTSICEVFNVDCQVKNRKAPIIDAIKSHFTKYPSGFNENSDSKNDDDNDNGSDDEKQGSGDEDSEDDDDDGSDTIDKSDSQKLKRLYKMIKNKKDSKQIIATITTYFEKQPLEDNKSQAVFMKKMLELVSNKRGEPDDGFDSDGEPPKKKNKYNNVCFL